LWWDGEGFICNPRRLKCFSFFLPCTKRNNENKNVRLPQQHFVRQFASSSTSSSSSSTPPTPPPPFSGGGGDDPYGKKAKEAEEKAKPAKQHKKKAGELYEEAKDKAEHMWEDTKEAASEAKETIMDAASAAKEKVQEKLSTATEIAKNVKETAKENVQGAKAKVKGTKEVRVLEFLCRVTGGARSLFMHLNLIYFSARYYFPPSLPTFLLIPQSAKHKMKETYEMVTEKLGATPQSAREYKKGMEETASETMDGKRRRRVTRKVRIVSFYDPNCVKVTGKRRVFLVYFLTTHRHLNFLYSPKTAAREGEEEMSERLKHKVCFRGVMKVILGRSHANVLLLFL